MQIYKGKGVYKGIAIGKIYLYSKDQKKVARNKIEDTKAEFERYVQAKEIAISQLGDIYDKAVSEVGQDSAQIFEVHMMLLEDEDYNESVENIINTQKVNAEYAVAVTSDNFAEMFEAMDDEYFRARSADIRDISERVISVLHGEDDSTASIDRPVIVAAMDLAPSETVQMDKSKLIALVTQLGSINSHTSILARTMGIPALIDIEIDEKWNGKLGIVDGYTGKFIINPDEATLKEYEIKKEKDLEDKRLLLELRGKENVTLSGKRMDVFANIGNLSDLAEVIKNDAGGIGLFRSEFIYLEKDNYPTEEEQFAVYKKVAQTMAGKKVIIRTLDIGADKQVDYFNMDKEENPALGYRAIRICLTRTDIFKTQLRAIFRASYFGNISIMYPMIISLDEVLKIKEIVAEIKEELDYEGISYGNIDQGIMIETPAAALISDLLAKEVDFFSIGTNDLTQYTLAIDRQNTKLDKFYNPHHEAVLRLIKLVADNAHKEGKWVGICGELGADTTLTETFLDYGIDELSVSPGSVLSVRKKIREIK